MKAGGDFLRGQAPSAGGMTLGQLRAAMNVDTDSADMRLINRHLDALINEFGEDVVISSAQAQQVLQAQSEEADRQLRNREAAARPGETAVDSNSAEALDSTLRDASLIAITQLRESLRSSTQRFSAAAGQQFADFLQQQGQLQRTLSGSARRSDGGGGNGCPPGFPFRIISGGNCFCCDNPLGTGACIACP